MDRLLIVGAADLWRSKNKHLPLGLVASYMVEQGEESGYRFVDADISNGSARQGK
ncbi:hypothetical protein D3C84_1241080 [compost metagenome]